MNLEQYREQLDKLDRDILEVLKKRFEISKQIGMWKKENNKPIEDLERETQVIESKIELSALPREFIEELFKLIFRQSKELQK